jgi:hypothetical protein
MDDKPILGRTGDEPDPPPEDGVVLYNPTPKPPPPIDESEYSDEPRHVWVWVVALVLVLGAAGGYVAIEGLPGSGSGVADLAEVPPMIPSGGEGGGEGLRPLPQPQIRATVADTVSIAMRATGLEGTPLPDTTVAFTVEAGEGVLGVTEVVTDAEGIARSWVALPETPGTTVVVAAVPGTRIPSSRIIVTALPGAPARIVLVGGDRQGASAGELLPERLLVRVADARDNPVPGVEVRFDVRSGGGITAPSRARTDSLGLASALWRLGEETGAQSLVATSFDLIGDVIFNATATERPRTTTIVDPSTGIESGPVRVGSSRFVIGGSHVCELRGTSVGCRGANDRGQATAAPLNGFVAVASGLSHVCGIDPDGSVYCWGANEAGQLGDGTLADRDSPAPVRTELRFSLVTAGAAHTCGLAGGGIPACWGLNVSGQLGDGSRNDQRGPRAVGGGLSFSTLVAGWNHTCGLTSSGNAFCWGLNSQGQLGDGSTLDRLVPTLVRGSVRSLVAGSAHTCGTSNGTVLCWGWNAYGQLGDGSTEDKAQPGQVQGLPGRATELAAGAVHTCALVEGGDAFCWGQNVSGQLGDGTNENRARPVPVVGEHRFVDLDAGGALTCATTADGARYCWGLNSSGQLGDGSRVSRTTPTRAGR